MRMVSVAGARPNFMKIAPLMDAFRAEPCIEPMLVHTGQHYDERMSEWDLPRGLVRGELRKREADGES